MGWLAALMVHLRARRRSRVLWGEIQRLQERTFHLEEKERVLQRKLRKVREALTEEQQAVAAHLHLPA